MSDDKRKKCEVVDGVVSECWAMAEVSEMPGRSKGIQHFTLVNWKTDKLRTFLAVKSGQHKQKGIVLNYCPFCGEGIGKHMEPSSDVG